MFDEVLKQFPGELSSQSPWINNPDSLGDGSNDNILVMYSFDYQTILHFVLLSNVNKMFSLWYY